MCAINLKTDPCDASRRQSPFAGTSPWGFSSGQNNQENMKFSRPGGFWTR